MGQSGAGLLAPNLLSSHGVNRLDTVNCFSSTSFGDSDATIQANGVRPRTVWPMTCIHLRVLSPRVILVEEFGTLMGLITVKDVLKFIAVERGASSPSWNDRRGLDVLLEEAWLWIRQLLQRWVNCCRSPLRR
jgi:hypothetical protein